MEAEMTNRSYDLQRTELPSENLRHPTVDLSEKLSTCFIPTTDHRSEISFERTTKSLHAALHRLGVMDLPGKEHVEAYLRYVARRNYKARTLNGILTAL